MLKQTRRDFLKNAAITSIGLGITSSLTRSAWARPLGANDDIRVAVIGLRNKGKSHIKDILKINGMRIVALCEVDPGILTERIEELKQKNINVTAYNDVRKLLEDKDIDAVVVATPNHWHAPITVWACQAGKDVYVEKPVSHNVWEGQQMIKAAHKYNRIVQSGTQARSNKDIPALIQYIKEGNLGKLLWIHGLWYKRRKSIGLKDPYYPEGIDYNLFCGPAPMVPLTRNNVHYDWHWVWNTGNGDLCNLGIHIFDIARWIAGYDTPPDRILSLGGRFVVDDAGQTPNTQLTLFDYSPIPIIMENRGLPMKPDINAMDHHHGIREGVIVQCENGYYAGSHGGWIYDNEGKQLKQLSLGGAENHMQNFIDCVRNRKYEDLKAPIETGHVSTSSCLIGNISYRIGQKTDVSKIEKKIGGNTLAMETFERFKEHLNVNSVDLKKELLKLGPWLTLDNQQGKITAVDGENGEKFIDQANLMLKDVYRPPFEIKEQV